MLEGEPLGGNRRIAEALSRRHRRTAGVTVARSTPVETALRGGPSLLAREHEELTSLSLRDLNSLAARWLNALDGPSVN